MARLEELLERVYDEAIVQVRARLEPFLEELQPHVPDLWTAVFNTCTARFNKYLFLNAPELWVSMSANDWLSIMSSGIVRSYRPSDVFDTGRYDDVTLLHRYVGVDSLQMFFLGAHASKEDRAAVTRHALSFTDVYIPDDWDNELLEEGEVYVTEGMLVDYRRSLQTNIAWLRNAGHDADTIRARVLSYTADDDKG